MFQLPPLVEEYLPWFVAGLIVVVGLFIYGLRDVTRFSLRRAWAISGVCFDESIRRRVLWITPLAIIGAVIVTQLAQPVDAQDAIRQAVKFCLFTTGLVVTVTAIILASTNLPREIDSRVIYTIVTKPTTRLEIIVGKVLGFARVSATILLIMGVFTFGYLHLRAYALRSDLQERLRVGDVDPISRETMEYYARAGLLTARTYLEPGSLRIYSRVPQPGDDRMWMFGGGGDQDFVVPFEVAPADLTPAGAPEGTPPGATGMFIRLNIGYTATAEAMREARESIPETVAAPDAPDPTPPAAAIYVQILDEELTTIVGDVGGGRPVVLTEPSGATATLVRVNEQQTASILKPGEPYTRLFVQVSGESPGVEYFVTATDTSSPVSLIVPGVDSEMRAVLTPDLRTVIQPPPDPQDPSRLVKPIFRGRAGTYGQQLRGGKLGDAPVAVFQFRSGQRAANIRPVDGMVPLELRVGIERSGEGEDDAMTHLQLTVLNTQTGFTSDPISLYPESTRTSYINVPFAAVEGGNFDIHVRNLTTGNYVGVLSTSISAVASEQNFDWNLLKSLLILWLMSLLVVIIAIFCSTFLSWPIAIILTIVLLLGHWAVLQLGEDAGPGIGARIATDLQFENPGVTTTVSHSVEALARLLRTLAAVLPDIAKFAAVEDIERGMTISPQRLIDPLKVLATFGLPILVLSYVILRNKEVAP